MVRIACRVQSVPFECRGARANRAGRDPGANKSVAESCVVFIFTHSHAFLANQTQRLNSRSLDRGHENHQDDTTRYRMATPPNPCPRPMRKLAADQLSWRTGSQSHAILSIFNLTEYFLPKHEALALQICTSQAQSNAHLLQNKAIWCSKILQRGILKLRIEPNRPRRQRNQPNQNFDLNC